MDAMNEILKEVREHYKRCPTASQNMSDMAKLYALVFLGIRHREKMFKEMGELQ